MQNSLSLKDGQTNLSGDTAAVSKEVRTIKQNEATRKVKPSLIPTLKSSTRKVPAKEKSNSSIKRVSKRPPFEHKNVQRVQHLNIDHNICTSQIKSPPKSVATARPIPTLQNIYRQDLSNETFNDWLLETVSEYQDVPEHFADLNTTSDDTQKGSDSDISLNNANNSSELGHLNNSLLNAPRVSNIKPTVNFKSTNENVKEWLATKLDYPTRDNESGYQSMSRPSQYNLSVKSKNSCPSKIFGDDKFYIFQSTLLSSNLRKNIYGQSNPDVILGEQPTVIINKKKQMFSQMHTIPKINTDIKLNTNTTGPNKQKVIYFPDFQRPVKYPSSPNPIKRNGFNEKNPHSSYVDYPSEVLQKTTNFDANGFATQSTVIIPKSEIQSDISSQFTTRQTHRRRKEYNVTTDSDTDWSRLQISQDNTTIGKSSKISGLTDESGRFSFHDDRNKQNSLKTTDKSSYHDYYYHYCWRKEVAKKNKAVQDLWDYKGRCKKCQKHRITPYRKKLPRSLKHLKRRMSIGRICRRRWNCVWKKTAERWSNWSKSPYKFRKFRTINLKKHSKWDDADVQTTIFVYNETGASVRSTSCEKSYLRHANVGPSMFRFYTNPVTLKCVFTAKLIGQSPNQSKATSYKSLRCQCNSFDAKTKECIFPLGIPDSEIKEDKIKTIESKNTSAISNMNLMKLVNRELQDAHTQMLITCYNAETNIKLTSDNDRDFLQVQTSDDFVCSNGVDEGIQTLVTTKSQRSIKTMTSNNNLQGLLNKEVQASPVQSIRKVSTFVVQDKLQDAKSSVVTDTSIPYRRVKNILMTPKGTILSCTGTKITSVSSVNIQTASAISRSPKITTSTAISTNLNTDNRDCLTAPSLYLTNLEDVSMGTDDPEVNRSEKSTSYAQFTDYINAGLSTSSLVKRVSFNDGTHHTQDNFGTGVNPERSSICVNTETDSKPKSIETGSSFERHFEFKNGTNKIDCYSQYSSRISRSNQLSNSSGHSARIGHSRLLSVRTLGDSVFVSPQPQTVCSSLDKKIKTTQHESTMSASQINSPDAMRKYETTKYIQEKIVIGEIDHLKPGKPGNNQCTIESNTSRVSNTEPTVVTSNLNAAKWIKECVNESKKDIQSIINLSESTVTESLERASFAMINCDVKKNLNVMKNLSNLVINQQRAVNCVTAKPLGVVSTISVTKLCPTKDIIQSKEQPITSNKPSGSNKIVVDNIVSGRAITNDVTESVQVCPEVQDAATDTDSVCTKIYKSDFAGSSHNLPNIFSYCDGNLNTNSKVAELLKEMTSRMTSCMLCTHAECCPGCNQPAKTDTSIQAVADFLTCSTCALRIAETLRSDQDTVDDQNWHLTSNCRYFSNLLAMKLALFKDKFQRYLAPSVDTTVYNTRTMPILFTEACTMKPSGRQDENCQTKILRTTKIKSKKSCFLSQAYSLIDIRGNQEKDDLKAVYNILTAIEGRVRRIKTNLHT